MSPPGLMAAPSTRCSTTTATPEMLIRGAHALLDAAGVHRSATWVTRTVRAYLRSPAAGLPFGQVLAAELQLNARQQAAMAARGDLRYVLEYSDPTGETAVRNVMAGSR